MGARHAEVGFGIWLVLSPFVFDHVADRRLLFEDLAAGLILLVVPLLCYAPRLRRAHLLLLLLAAWLIGSGWWATFQSTEPLPAHQNHIVVGLLLLLTAVVPSRAAEPPPGWVPRRERAGSR